MPEFTVGDPAPWFITRSASRPDFHLSQCAGRYVVLCFIGSAGQPGTIEMLAAMQRRRDLYNDDFATIMVVSSDPEDERQHRLKDWPGLYVMWDEGARVAATYGLIRESAAGLALARRTFVLDPLLRVLAVLPIADPAEQARQVNEFVAGLPPHPPSGAGGPTPPVLILPRIFEPELCRLLIARYHTANEDSGFMRDHPVSGQTVAVHDHSFKRRRDHHIADEGLREHVRAVIHRRLAPEVQKAFAFQVTHIERFLVACYTAAHGGHFRGHRDNTTKGTAHRRFAVTINLNAEDYEGGDLLFPEFDRRTYRAPTGGAVVFSCSLMHEATRVTSGERYCFLPFLYDDAAAALRRENLKYVARPA